MDGIGAVIKLVAHLQHHTLIDIQASAGDLAHHLTVFPGIHDTQLTHAFADAHHLAIGVAGRAFLVVDQQDVGA